MKYGLTLEGGGARGAYHIGAVKALLENGYEFGAIVGTSIGAINAAFLAQGDFDEIYKMWKTLSFSDLFDIDEDKIIKAMKADINFDTVKYLTKKLGKSIKEKGIETDKMKALLTDKIDEEKLRKSSIKFGLVTFCLSDVQGKELYINDMEKGSLINYLMASSNLPVFQRISFNDKKYIDGGIYDNCPVHMLEKEGFDNVIAIRTYKRMRIRGYHDILKRNKVSITMISPVDTLPSILNFETNNLKELLKMGYYDALKMIKKLDGIRYYIYPKNEEEIFNKLNKINYDKVIEIAKTAKIRLEVGQNISDFLLYKIIPILAAKTKNKEIDNVKDGLYAIVEHIAIQNNIKRYKLYKFENLIKEIKNIENIKLKDKHEEAMYELIINI